MPLGKKNVGEDLFAECRRGTRRRKGSVMAVPPLTVALPSA
jgi:hypothetical protein